MKLADPAGKSNWSDPLPSNFAPDLQPRLFFLASPACRSALPAKNQMFLASRWCDSNHF
jgi:hypothetical protein